MLVMVEDRNELCSWHSGWHSHGCLLDGLSAKWSVSVALGSRRWAPAGLAQQQRGLVTGAGVVLRHPDTVRPMSRIAEPIAAESVAEKFAESSAEPLLAAGVLAEYTSDQDWSAWRPTRREAV